jgi:hypothetical protein
MKKLSFWASIASIIGLAFTLYPSISTKPTTTNTNTGGTQAIGNSGETTITTIGKSETVNINSEPKIPKFEGEIGHYEKSKLFTNFIFKNEGKKVFIDAFYIPNDIDEISINNNNNFGVDYLHLWENCFEELKTDEKPSVVKCQGVGISIDRSNFPKDADMTYIRNKLSIKGYFAIKGCFGPHQGSMGCTIRPLNPEDV